MGRAASEPTGLPQQTQPGPTGFRTLTSPPSIPTGNTVKLNLNDAELGPHATFIQIGGEEAILLTAPPNGEANFTLKVKKPLGIAPGSLVRLRASIRVEEIGATNPHVRSLFRRENTGNRLQMIMDEKTIYDKEVKATAGKFEQVQSEKTTFSDNPIVEVVQKAGKNPVALTVRGLSFVKSAGPTKEPTIPPEEPTIPPEEQTIPPEESTFPTGEPTFPAEVTGTESVSGGQETTVSGGTGKSGGGKESGSYSSVSNLESETGTGTPTRPVSPTTPGPVQIIPNEGGHCLIMNTIAVYGVPLIAAILV
ncbi:hypothetical protein FOQG_18315 [Fusarium oxysporum f. sp. raphani 54005]|uniref:Uncharacterized protein n=1 Tax=Fusarium oxysporum f. sp. raphani 54005 TaxID=1089458 RepID=X0C2D9_FUSOX|nr:hypothetical protein FOQG_18315 [Fusarium oxysporum f. sp. raphani 54005]